MFDRHFYPAKVVRVVSYDVLCLAIDVGFGLTFTTHVSLYGVNFPYIDPRRDDPADFVKDWLNSGTCFVRTIRNDDGSWSGYVYSDANRQACLNDDLVDGFFRR